MRIFGADAGSFRRKGALRGASGEIGSRLVAEPETGGQREEAMADLLAAAMEIGELSRLLVEASMEGAHDSSLQRVRVLDVMQKQECIRVAAEKNGTNSRLTAKRVGEVTRDIDEGSEILEATIKAMQETARAVMEGGSLMRDFVENMGEVRRIVGTIKDIAGQTNLLALNAAITAAHASEDGRAFSVIAQEVRMLANRTSEATTEISEKIGRLAESAAVAEKAMQSGRLAVEGGIQQNLSLQRSFIAVREAMHEVERMSAEVAIASDRQISEGTQVAESIKAIDDLAEKSTREADTAAEMNMRVVSCTARLQEGLAVLNVGESDGFVEERAATRRFLSRLDGHQENVQTARLMLQRMCAEAGHAAVHGVTQMEGMQLPALHFGRAKVSDAIAWVDSVNAQTKCNATIFVRHGDRFIRVATNVRRSDGERATGTALNTKGIAANKLLRGEAYRGAVYILGKPVQASYEPLISAQGELIGALYVGDVIRLGRQSAD
jgi:Cache 3/Cache 2 fusion domain/Methyl-accepting chemotaxis protein (MCP) signalling domain